MQEMIDSMEIDIFIGFDAKFLFLPYESHISFHTERQWQRTKHNVMFIINTNSHILVEVVQMNSVLKI